MDAIEVHDLGRMPYPAAHEEMQRRVEARRRGGPNVLLLVEHDHVFTRGRKSRDLTNILAAGDVPVVAVERGGDVTYHGPGQLVAYPIVKLEDEDRDAPQFIRRLEGWIMATMAALGVDDGERRPGFSGVWCRGKKVASVGVAVTADWITWHGIALNVSTDLSYFARINPCGLEATVMTTLERLANRDIPMQTAREAAVATVSSLARSTTRRVLALKELPRAGWVRVGVSEPESVAAHSWGVAWLVLVLCPDDLDRGRALAIATIHDLAEIRTGDITPHDGVDEADKSARETEAFRALVSNLPTADELIGLWAEYEHGTSPEGRFVKACDKLDMALQAARYADAQGIDTSEFVESALQRLDDATLQALARG